MLCIFLITIPPSHLISRPQALPSLQGKTSCWSSKSLLNRHGLDLIPLLPTSPASNSSILHLRGNSCFLLLNLRAMVYSQCGWFYGIGNNVSGFDVTVTFLKIKVIIGIRGFQTSSKQVFIQLHSLWIEWKQIAPVFSLCPSSFPLYERGAEDPD